MSSVSCIICETLPRSGHNVLYAMLAAGLGERLVYERRAGAEARKTPYTRTPGGLTILRTHDPQLDDPTDCAGALYVIHYRDPLGHVLSYAEHAKRTSGDFAPGDGDHMTWWLAMQASRMIAFLEKWMPPAPNRVHLRYDQLVADPADAAARVVARCGYVADAQGLARAAGRMPQRVARPIDRPDRKPPRYVPRNMNESPVIGRVNAGLFSAAVRARTAFVDWPPDPWHTGEPDPAFLRTVDLMRALAWPTAALPDPGLIGEAEASPNARVRKIARRARSRLQEAAA